MKISDRDEMNFLHLKRKNLLAQLDNLKKNGVSFVNIIGGNSVYFDDGSKADKELRFSKMAHKLVKGLLIVDLEESLQDLDEGLRRIGVDPEA